MEKKRHIKLEDEMWTIIIIIIFFWIQTYFAMHKTFTFF